jgi:hypothetical protein
VAGALSGRRGAAALGIVLLFELAALPWTAHAYDAASFFSHADRVFFAGVAANRLWAFGSIPLIALMLSQLPVLLFPQLWSAVAARIALLKLPAWTADVFSAGIIRACAGDPAAGNLWALRYLLDPIVVFVTVFHGQSDAIPNVFVVAGVAATLAERYELAGAMFGLGAGSKFYPAAFVPLLLVVALRRSSWRRAATAALTFLAVSAITLVPILLGRAGSVAGAWANNSFGPEGTRVATASLWALFPGAHAVGLTPQIEQSIAIAVPVLLALRELRHVPDRRDVARAAMLSAMAIVLLNPGAHPPFYLWVAGPLVLYAAVTGDGVVSLAGIAISVLAILTQFCQEGSDEYFLLAYGPGPQLGLLRCFAPFALLQGLTLISAAVAVVASHLRRPIAPASLARCASIALAAAACFCVIFGGAVTAEARYDAATHADRNKGFTQEEALVNTFAVTPNVDRHGSGCTLTYDAPDIVVYAGNSYAARFGSASLGYTLFSPSVLTVRGRRIDPASLPSTFERSQVLTLRQTTVTLTREFDVSALLRPFRYLERVAEKPCNLIEGNPVLIYRFDFAAARAAAAVLPLRRRWQLLGQETLRLRAKARIHA